MDRAQPVGSGAHSERSPSHMALILVQRGSGQRKASKDTLSETCFFRWKLSKLAANGGCQAVQVCLARFEPNVVSSISQDLVCARRKRLQPRQRGAKQLAPCLAQRFKAR